MPGETPAVPATPPAGTPPPSPAAAAPPAGQPVQPQGAPPPQAGAPQGSAPVAQPPEKPNGQPGTPAAAALAIKLPDGSKADPKFVEAYTAQATKLGASQEVAQGFWDFLSQSQAEGQKTLDSAWQRKVSQELDEVRGDKQLGGANFDKSMRNRDEMLGVGGKEFKERALRDGMVSITDPGFIRLLAIARAGTAEDSIGDKGGRPPPSMTTRESELRQLFPNSYDQMVPKRA